MSMLENFKNNKKVMQIKMEQANKMADDAANEFIDSIKSLVKDASVEDIKALVETDDEMVEKVDKLAILAAFAEQNDDDMIIIGIEKQMKR